LCGATAPAINLNSVLIFIRAVAGAG
jgi:hypothetical protein